MEVLTGDRLVVNALTQAASQQVAELKTAEAQLSEWETKPGYYLTLLRIITNYNLDPSVRCLAAMSLKSGIDKYWRRSAPNAIADEEKLALRAGLMETLKEPVNQVAVQLAVLIAKAARIDYPQEWPDLIPSLVNVVVNNEDSLVQHRACLILHHVIKTLASKRLAGDRRSFQQLTTLVYSYFLELYNSLMDSFFLQVQNNDPGCHGTLEKTLLTLRILRKMTIHGCKEPRESQHVVLFINSVFDRAKSMLLVRKGAAGNSTFRDLIDKVVIHLTKVLLSLLEHHPFSFLPFIQSSLSFSVSLIFTPEGEGLLFERFVVQCLNLIKGVLLCAEYKLPKQSSEEDNPNSEALQATRMKREFFQTAVLTEVCRKLVTHYFLLTRDELELWDCDPEGFMNEEGGESWKYNLRPCTEAVFLALFREYRDTLAPLLLELVYSNYQPVDPNDLPAVLRKDAVYLAVGLAAFDLYDEIDMDKWFSSLLQELLVKDTNYRIIRRRAAWLLGEWCGVKLSQEFRPALYRALMPLLQGDEDMAVRLTAANALKIAIDDFDFESAQFLEFLQPIFSLLFNLLKEAKECDTKMHVLTVQSIIVERVGVAIRPHSSALLQYLPLLWEESANHNMLRCAIVSTLVHCVRVLLSEQLAMFLYPVIELCVDTTQEPHVYLLEDGLELWLAMLENSTVLPPPMLNLVKRMPYILELTTEHMQQSCLIMQAYLLLSPQEFLMEYGEAVFTSCHSLLEEITPEGLVTVFLLVETALCTDPSSSLHFTMPILLYVFQRVHNGGAYPMVMSMMLSLLSRVLLHSRDVFCEIVGRISRMANETAEAALDKILEVWLERMALVTQKEKRKLLALALTSLITAGSSVVLNKMPSLLRNVVETLNDIVDVDDANRQTDCLLLAEVGQMYDEGEAEATLETEHERRLKRLADRDPIYNIDLRHFLQCQMNELKTQIGPEALEQMFLATNKDIRDNLLTYITL